MKMIYIPKGDDVQQGQIQPSKIERPKTDKSETNDNNNK